MHQHRDSVPCNPHINLNAVNAQSARPQNPRNAILSLVSRTSPMRNNNNQLQPPHSSLLPPSPRGAS